MGIAVAKIDAIGRYFTMTAIQTETTLVVNRTELVSYVSRHLGAEYYMLQFGRLGPTQQSQERNTAEFQRGGSLQV